MKTATTGPLIVYGDRNPPGTGATGTVNPDKAPSVFWGGTMLMDPRIGYNVTRYGVMGWSNLGDIVVIDAVPSALGTGGVNSAPNNIAAAQAPVSGTPLTLRSSTGSGITVISTAFTAWPSGNTIAANTLAVEQAFGLVNFGVADVATGLYPVNAYDPTKAITRNVVIGTNNNDTGGTYTIAGYDLYGYPQTEAITGVNNTTVSGAKAWKYITSVTPSGTINSTSVSVGTGDVYGLPLLANTFGYVEVFWNNAWVTSSTGFTAAVTTNPATSTTGDPRGTYAVQGAASNGTLRLNIAMAINPNNLGTTAGLFGVTPA